MTFVRRSSSDRSTAATAFRRMLALAAAAGLALNMACYSYSPSPLSPPPVRANVRVELTEEGTTQLARYLGPRVAAAEGTVSSAGNDGAVTVAVTWVQLLDGQRQPWSGDGLVAFPRAYVARVQQRTLNRRKSYIAAVAMIGALIVVSVLVMAGAGGGGVTEAPSAGGIGLR